MAVKATSPISHWPVHDGNINNRKIKENLKVVSQNVDSKNLDVGEEVTKESTSIVMATVVQDDSKGLFVVWLNSIAKVNVISIDCFDDIYAKGIARLVFNACRYE